MKNFKKNFKKIITLSLLAFVQLGVLTGMTFAEGNATQNNPTGSTLKENQVLVSERPLGAKSCKCAKMDQGEDNKRRLLIQ